MKYYSKNEIEKAIKNNETIVINDEIIDKMRNGEFDSYVIREGLCGKNIKKWDFSGLSEEHLAYMSFDNETQFPEYLQEKADRLLEKSRCIMQEIEELHKMGLDGTGRKITIIDTPFELTKEDEDIKYYQMNGVELENHGITVLSIIKAIAPNAQIIFVGDDKRAGKNREQNLNNFIRENLDSAEIYDSDVISISSPINVDNNLVNNRCEILNSPRFYSSSQENLGFRYGIIRRNGNVESIEPADCISEGKDRKADEKFCLEELEKLGLKYTEINSSNIDEIVNRLKNIGISEDDPKITFIRKIAMSDEEYRISSINEERLRTPGKMGNQELVCIPSAGITVRQNNGKFKYMATNSNSFSIPVVSALFTIARQINPNISLKEFSNICKRTAIEKEGVKTITPLGIMKEIQERNKTKSIQGLVQESIEGMPNFASLYEIEQAQEMQQRTITKQGKTQKNSQINRRFRI